jgi:ATP-dependent RNA helicase DDX31/DBP7
MQGRVVALRISPSKNISNILRDRFSTLHHPKAKRDHASHRYLILAQRKKDPPDLQSLAVSSRRNSIVMADDGMLLNFSIPETGILNKPTFRGGTWRDRLTAKKAAGNWHSRATGRLNGETIEPKTTRTKASEVNATEIGIRTKRQSKSPQPQRDDELFERPPKRARASGDFRPRDTRDDAQEEDFRPQSSAEVTKKPGHDSTKGGKKQIISSLFTYNPASSTKLLPKEETQPEATIEPSNAPLTSELDTFTSLGISATLATHLLKKMDLKAPTAIQKAAIAQLVTDDSDAYIQAETGSGKTLAYLLPIVQRIMELSANMKKRKVDEAVHRDSGLFAIILAPTRELSKQIASVLERLLGCAHWIVAGTVIGGEKKKSEKARLRKGLNILVATPGRLADHLEHTEALDVSNVRWLVLDEGDRLMELGFEDEIQKIVGTLNNRMRAKKESRNAIPGLPEKRTTVLCSATMKMDVERLGQISLKDAVHIKAEKTGDEDESNDDNGDQAFYAPAQLKQSYAVVAPKLRLVSLISFLKRAFVRKGSIMKAIVFISCADSVDFHFDILTGILQESDEKPVPQVEEKKDEEKDDDDVDDDDEKTEAVATTPKKIKPTKGVIQSDPTKLVVTHAESPSLSSKTHSVTTYRLHGSLPQAVRTSTLAHFTKNKEPCLLLATDVASRGLDLPDVDLVIEFDPAFARDDHLHRIGRTARAGRDGRACIFLMPGCEEGYVDILKSDRKNSEAGVHIGRQDAEEILKKGLITSGVTGKDKMAYMQKATDLQLAVERWALASPARMESARRAFQAHVRAYTTHVAAERGYFDIKQLHLGHLAKAFALRERPSGLKVPGLRTGAGRETQHIKARVRGAGTGKPAKEGKPDVEVREIDASEEAAKMRKAVRAREKFMRHAGMADEFNLG